MKSNWIATLWEIVQTLATLSKDVERVNTETINLRKDVFDLAQNVRDLKSMVVHEKETTKLVLDSHVKELDFSEATLRAKFDVLTTRLDAKIAEFEHQLRPISSPRQSVLESDTEKKESPALSSVLPD